MFLYSVVDAENSVMISDGEANEYELLSLKFIRGLSGTRTSDLSVRWHNTAYVICFWVRFVYTRLLRSASTMVPLRIFLAPLRYASPIATRIIAA